MSSKPELRRLLQSQIKKHLGIAIGLGIVGGVAFKYLVCDPFKQRYIDFYKTYDIDKEFNLIRNTGAFDSCAPDA